MSQSHEYNTRAKKDYNYYNWVIEESQDLKDHTISKINSLKDDINNMKNVFIKQQQQEDKNDYAAATFSEIDVQVVDEDLKSYYRIGKAVENN